VAHSVFEYWEHLKTGAVFAVETSKLGELLGVCGPLNLHEIGLVPIEQLSFQSDLIALDFLKANELDFALYETRGKR
jgi:hypothetical protein